MKKIIYIFLISTSLIFAQKGDINIKGIDSLGNFNYNYVTKFIQIEVHDSIELKEIVSYDLLISIDKDRFPLIENDTLYYGDDNEMRAGSDYLKTKLLLEKELKAKKLKYKFYYLNTTLPFKTYFTDNYLINLKNDTKSPKLIDELKRIKFIEGFRYTNLYYKDEEKVDEILFANLLKNAKKKALMISEKCGVKLGEIIEINENTSSYIIKRREHLFENRYRVRSIIVKYSIED